MANCEHKKFPTPVLVPGWNGSGENHWQAIWRTENSAWKWVEQNNWAVPDPTNWVSGIDRVVADCSESVLIVAHSLGCHAFAHWVNCAGSDALRKLKGALLVAPADVERDDCPHELRCFSHRHRRSLAVPTMLIASENDPYMALPAARTQAKIWGSTFVNAGAVGHINVASGHGQWNFGKTLLKSFMEELAA